MAKARIEVTCTEVCPVSVACADGSYQSCLEMSRAHSRKLALCDALERLADSLPLALDRLVVLNLASELVPLLRESHRHEEDAVFPAFEAGGANAIARANSIQRLKAEHVEDECAAQDLTDVLLAIGHGGAPENPEALGFMLRAFFETLRRHIAFEREHVLPALIGAHPPVH